MTLGKIERLDVEQADWLRGRFDGLTDEIEILTPSAWAEAKRYLPPQQSAMPGFYRFNVAPYLREILDCLGFESSIREVSVMKGVQLGFTVGILENFIGYCIDHVRNAPVMLVTADLDLARERVTGNIVPMLQYSGLADLIRSGDEIGKKKTGKTEKRIEWFGGGYLVPFGANSANKMRSLSIQVLLRDEVDGWPLKVGRDGDPVELTRDRTAAYESSRKVANISTPTLEAESKIKQLFRMGDQRYYYVCCLDCGHSQRLRWRRTNPDTGEVTGIVWETDEGRLVPGTVRYLCSKCGHPHTNDDKTKLLSPEYGAEWRPTAKPATPDHRSYHLNALYSPVGMQTWEACVLKWLEAWDPETGRPRDNEVLQVFYNNVLGETFAQRGERVRFEEVSAHRRKEYGYGCVPNEFARKYCGGPVHLVTCAVDVHQNNLAVATFGWCKDKRAILLDYQRYEGDTEQLDDENTWQRLHAFLVNKVYESDDGAKYPIALTLVDSGYRTDHVHQFCASFDAGVFPIKGQEIASKRSLMREFSDYKTPQGRMAYNITVDLYKERWRAALKRVWGGEDVQPVGHFNAPLDATDSQLKELTREVKRERIEQTTGKRVGWEWHRPSGAKNELWDLLIYSSAALDLLVWDMCCVEMQLEQVDWPGFWEWVEQERPYVYDGV